MGRGFVGEEPSTRVIREAGNVKFPLNGPRAYQDDGDTIMRCDPCGASSIWLGSQRVTVLHIRLKMPSKLAEPRRQEHDGCG